MRILSPTENKRFNEMVGFVGLSLAVLLALSLLSYSPHDASFNVSAPAAAGRHTQLDRTGRSAHGRSFSSSSAASRRSCFLWECSRWRCAGSAASNSRRLRLK